MTDSYLDFANSPVGARLADALGLPKPLKLERYKAGQPVIKGSVLLGGAGDPQMLGVLAPMFKAMGAQTVAHAQLPQWMPLANKAGLMTGRWGVDGKPGEKVKALVFDATGMNDSTQSDALYTFFHDAARSVLPCGRVVVIGRPPEACENPRKTTVQRALEGLTRSLAKELKKAIGVQLVYVAEGAEGQIESTLRFLLSPRSAYVSAQVIRIGAPVGDSTVPSDWNQPLAGKKVLVTGASRGIGASIAEVMAREGATVICLDVPQAQAGLDEVAAKVKGRALALDIGAAEAPQALVDAALADGGWDVVVHNAGITRDKTIANMKEHFWQNGGQRQPLHPGAHQRRTGGVRCPEGGRAHRLRVVDLRHRGQHGADQLRLFQGRRGGHGAEPCAGVCEEGHHHQCRGAGVHRDPDDRCGAIRHSRSRAPHELDEPGGIAGGRGRSHWLVCITRVRRHHRQRGARLRPEHHGGVMATRRKPR